MGDSCLQSTGVTTTAFEDRLWGQLELEQRVAEALEICHELKRLLACLRFELALTRLQSTTPKEDAPDE